MSSDSAPAPPKNYFQQYTPGAIGSANSSIGSFAQMPNYGQQTYSQFQPGMAGSSSASGWDPTQAVNAGTSMIQGSQALSPYVQQLLQMGLDPNSGYYNTAAHNTEEQSNAELSKRGLAMSPYGAGVTGNVMANFNNDWQNQQVQRAATAGGAASGLQGTINQGVQGGASLAAQAPQWQAQIAQMMSALGNNAYAFPQQTIQDWMQFGGMGQQAGQQNYQDQFQNYQANQQANNSMWSGLGNLAGNAASMAMFL